MIKKVLSLLLGLLLTSSAIAQEYQKEWSQGKLTWQDFTEKENTRNGSELKFFFGYETGKQKFGDTIVKRTIAKSYLDKELSWVNPRSKTAQSLRYNQVIFDIIEINRRKLQKELDKVKYSSQGSDRFNRINKLCNNEIAQFQHESNLGENINSIKLWEQKKSTDFKFHTNTQLPDFEAKAIGYALHAGFGSGILTGSLGNHFTPTFNFIFGFDLAYNNSILYLNGTIAGGKVKKDYTSNILLKKGEAKSVAIIDLSYGYAFINNNKLKLAPFAGLGITEFTNQKDKESNANEEKDVRLVDYSLIFGINADYKLRTLINLGSSAFLGVKEKVETSIRARLYISKVNYYDDLQGYSINLTLGMCGFGNFIQLK